MEDISSISQSTPFGNEEADDFEGGYSDVSESPAIEASAGDLSQGPVKAEVSLEAKQPFAKRRSLWGMFATVASALLLATIMRKRLEAFEKPNVEPAGLLGGHEEKLMEAPENPTGEHTGPQRALEEEFGEASEKPKVDSTKTLGVPQKELIETTEKPEVKLTGPPGVSKEEPEKALEKPKVELLPPEQTVAKLAEWAKEERDLRAAEHLFMGVCEIAVPERKALLFPELEEEKFEAVVLRGGVRYILRAYFLKVTPAFDPEETAAILSDGVTKLLKECIRDEQDAYKRDVFRTPTAVFGDTKTAQIFVVLACECTSDKGLGATLQSALLKSRPHCKNLVRPGALQKQAHMSGEGVLIFCGLPFGSQ
ncbi:hypothetical protein Emag_004149 [Eimeria magna]